MAPKNWNDPTNVSPVDPTIAWCNNTTTALAGTFGTAVGTGAENTVLMDAGCTSGAGQSAADYVGGGKSDWFLPSQGELQAMYNYKNSIVDTATYGFTRNNYWSSSQYDPIGGYAWFQSLNAGHQGADAKSYALRVRPVRSF